MKFPQKGFCFIETVNVDAIIVQSAFQEVDRAWIIVNDNDDRLGFDLPEQLVNLGGCQSFFHLYPYVILSCAKRGEESRSFAPRKDCGLRMTKFL
jgi:hypothetical protein